jgi:hypothetical protein
VPSFKGFLQNQVVPGEVDFSEIPARERVFERLPEQIVVAFEGRGTFPDAWKGIFILCSYYCLLCSVFKMAVLQIICVAEQLRSRNPCSQQIYQLKLQRYKKLNKAMFFSYFFHLLPKAYKGVRKAHP